MHTKVRSIILSNVKKEKHEENAKKCRQITLL